MGGNCRSFLLHATSTKRGTYGIILSRYATEALRKFMIDHSQFQSPFTWRYGSAAMRSIWSEEHKRRLWRRIWVALAQAQREAGLVGAEQVDDLHAHIDHIDVARALEIEARIHHDLMAELQVFAEQCAIGGGIIHLGATSADIEDNADALRIREALQLILTELDALLARFAERIDELAAVPTIAFTHLQPAEPTTMGYRLCLYAQDLLEDRAAVERMHQQIRGKGIKGAVGTSASYADLLDQTPLSPAALEARVMAALDLPSYPIAGQVYPRKQDWQLVTTLAGLASSLSKFAFDLRLLQSPLSGEWRESFGAAQVGSSAMPFKRNPIQAEKLNSLGRLVASLVSTVWNNASASLLERTLDDSANRREILPVAFLAIDEMLAVSKRLLDALQIERAAADHLLERYGLFAAVERVLMAAARAGADRQAMHEHLREMSMKAWQSVKVDEPNPLPEMLATSPLLQRYLSVETIHQLLDARTYTGDAPERARQFAAAIRSRLHHRLEES